ncbi:MAG: hypothetical protein WCP25_08080 [Polynucleobacter sp.]
MTPLKKAVHVIAAFIKRIQLLNFKTAQELLEAHYLEQQIAYLEQRRRDKRFAYYFKVFGLKDSCPFDETTELEALQHSLIWKLVDLEDGHHE